MRISDWSSDVCSSDLAELGKVHEELRQARRLEPGAVAAFEPRSRLGYEVARCDAVGHRTPEAVVVVDPQAYGVEQPSAEFRLKLQVARVIDGLGRDRAVAEPFGLVLAHGGDALFGRAGQA